MIYNNEYIFGYLHKKKSLILYFPVSKTTTNKTKRPPTTQRRSKQLILIDILAKIDHLVYNNIFSACLLKNKIKSIS